MSEQMDLPLPRPKILQRCWPFLIAYFKGDHQIPSDVVAREYGHTSGTADHVEVRLHCDSLATHDWSKLTELVLLAHAHRLRAELSAGDEDDETYRGLMLRLWDRAEAKGKWIPAHPGLNYLLTQIEGLIADGGAA